MANPEHLKIMKQGVETSAQKQFDPEETLPWEHLGGPKKKYLLRHYDDANL